MSAQAISVLRIPVRPGAEEEFARIFDQLRVFEEAQKAAGLLHGRLLRPRTPGEPFVVVGEWESPDDYQRWLESPVRGRLARSLEQLADEEPAAGEIYTVVRES